MFHVKHFSFLAFNLMTAVLYLVTFSLHAALIQYKQRISSAFVTGIA